MKPLLISLFLFSSFVLSKEKNVIICGIAKNIGQGAQNTIDSCEKLINNFDDYRIIIYENNSTDETKQILGNWAKTNSKILFLTEDLNYDYLKKNGLISTPSSCVDRMNQIARARNILLDEISQENYKNFNFVIMADLDMQPWDVDEILNVLSQEEYDWDCVVGNGLYDSFALRTKDCFIGWETIGNDFWRDLPKGAYNKIKDQLETGRNWKKIISGFGGIGIYKKDSIKNCRYSAYMTKNSEKIFSQLIISALKSKPIKDIPFLDSYKEKLKKLKIQKVNGANLFFDNNKFSGVIVTSPYGLGKLIYFGIEENNKLPWTCEHINFNADMIANGKDKIYFNPNLKSNQN